MPPSYSGARASIATQCACVGSPTESAPAASRLAAARPVEARAANAGSCRPAIRRARCGPTPRAAIRGWTRSRRPPARSVRASMRSRPAQAATKRPPSSSSASTGRVVADLHPERRGAAVVRVDERLAAAQEERVGAAKCSVPDSEGWKRTPCRRIHGAACADARIDEARERLVGRAAGDLAAGPASTPLRDRRRSARPRARRACSASCACARSCRRATHAGPTRPAAPTLPPRARSAPRKARRCRRRSRARRSWTGQEARVRRSHRVPMKGPRSARSVMSGIRAVIISSSRRWRSISRMPRGRGKSGIDDSPLRRAFMGRSATPPAGLVRRCS